MRTQDGTYTDLITLRDKLDLQHSRLQEELAEIARKLESVSTTLELLETDARTSDHEESRATADARHDISKVVTDKLDLASLRGLTQLGALKKIAEHNDGVLVTSTAKRIMLQAGLIKSQKNANNILFSVIQRSGQFGRISPGIYALGAMKPERPSIFVERA